MNDHKLPGLIQATDDEAMRILLSAALRRGSPNCGPGFTRLRHQVLKHRPGKRCVIEYWLESEETPFGSRRMIGKLFRENRGEKVFANLLSLWNAAQEHSPARSFFGMPEPLAYLPELGMVLQSVVPGRQLSGFSEHDDLPAAVRAVARNLAVLHGLSVPTAEKSTMAEHLKKYCHPGPQTLLEACPDLAPLVEGILHGLAADESLQRAPICPVHGDLGLMQIFIAEDRAFFIDFDDFCLAHAALDVSNFLIALEVHFAPRSALLEKRFFETYLQSRPPESLAGLGLHQAFIYLRRAMICYRLQADADWRRQARQLLEKGNAAL